jgi:geranylgeranyl diphosphate synthase, type I
MYYLERMRLLAEEVELLFASLPEEVRLLLKEPLSVKRRALAIPSENDSPWVILPLIVCEAICGNFEKALPLGASIQFFMAAGDVFDDIEDNDSPDSLCARYGIAIANNVATTLLVLGEKAIAHLKDKNVNETTIVRILDVFNAYYLNACAGQHLDLSVNKEENISEDAYLKILELKSASQVECACYTGALLATDNDQLTNVLKDFGFNLGMMAQITNDISGITNGKDLLKRKISLPVIFALSQTEGENCNLLKDYYFNKSESCPNTQQILCLISDIGALHYAAVKLESYRIYAADALNRAEQAGIKIDRMRVFLK